MKRISALLLTVTWAAAPAMAERIVVLPGQIEMIAPGGELSAPNTVMIGGHDATVRSLSNIQRTLFSAGDTRYVYDNVPFVLGGAGSPAAGTWAFYDWVGADAQWQNYVTLAQHGVITNITYTYVGDSGSSNTHSIQFRTGAVAPPGTAGTFSGVGATIATVVLPSLPGTIKSSFVQIVITGLRIPVTTSHLYVGFDEAGAEDVFWLTGGLPGIGSVPGINDGLVLFDPNYFGPNLPLSYSLPGYPYTGTGLPLHPHTTFALALPEPLTIGLLTVGGVLALRRRGK